MADTKKDMKELEREIRSNPVKWAYWKLKDPKGRKWKARWYQKQIIDDIMDGERRIAARMGRRVGKCLPGSTRIFDPSTGKEEKIVDLYERQEATVATMTEDFKLKESAISEVWDNGKKEVFKVRLKSGREIEGTANHPLYRIDGWTEISDLKEGDKIATPRELNFFGNYEMEDYEVESIALKEKEKIPDSIMQLPKEKLALFLSRLYATDGWASSTESPKKHLEIGYCSSSEELARGVQHLLLRFGIQSYLREKWPKYNGKRHKTYSIGIHGLNHVKRFAKEIGIFSKEEALNKLLAIADTMTEKDDHLPFEVMEEVEQLREEKRIRPREMLHPNASMNDRYRRQYAPQRKTLSHWADVLESDRLKALSDSDIFWDEIVSIESQGIQQTYDLSVPETKNFVANDIIVHNSEAMIVYCLWYAFHHKNRRLLIATPYEHQVRLIFMRLNELIDGTDELSASIETRTKNPFITKFNNESAIMGFTVGANSGQSGASVRGQRADSKLAG